MKAYVGVDQSYTGFGLVVYYADGSYNAQKGTFPTNKYANDVERLLAIEGWLTERLPDNIAYVAMEGYANGAKFGREQAGELGAVVKRALYKTTGSMPAIVKPTVLKKYITGSGAAKKNQILLGVFKRWGEEFTDDNLADAYGLARFAADLDRVQRGDTDGIWGFQLDLLESALKMPTA